ncbi:hypothetical protein FGB62_2g148 [Gracilaria domingensis]|nr:hypothetical protein FGB62_2g148 [Gracilaria domingensis]
MAPRKGPSESNKPKVVRRVVKTVTTEEFFDGEGGGESKRTVTTEVVEETLDSGGPLLPKVSKTIQKKSKSTGVAAKGKKATSTGRGTKQTGSKSASKTAANKTTARRTAASKTAVGKATASKAAASKTAASKTAASKTAASKTAASKTAASKTAASKVAASRAATSKPAARKPAASKTAASAAKSKAQGLTAKMDVHTSDVVTSASAKRGARKSTTPTSAAKKTGSKVAVTKPDKVTTAAPPISKSTSAGARATKTKTPSKVKPETKPVTPKSATKTKPETKAASLIPSTSQGRAGTILISKRATSKRQPTSTAACKTTMKGKTEAPTSSAPAKTVRKQAAITKSEGKLRVQTRIRKESTRKDVKPSKQVKGEVYDVMNARLLNEAYLAGKQAAQDEMNELALHHYCVLPEQMVTSLDRTCERLPSAVEGSGMSGSAGANAGGSSHAASAMRAASFPSVTPTRRARRVKQTARRSSVVRQGPNLSGNQTGDFVPPYMSDTAIEHVPNDARAAVPTRQARRVKRTARKSAVSSFDLLDEAPSNTHTARQVSANDGVQRVLTSTYTGGDWFDASHSLATHAAPQVSANNGDQRVSTSSYIGGDWFAAAPSASTHAPRQVNASSGIQRVSKLNSSGSGDFVWTLVHEQGFFPDGFHSYMEPTKRELGEFRAREEAVRVGKNNVGNEDYPWEELVEGGDLEIVSDNETKWEALWSPPDSQYSRVTAMRVCVARGRWLVEAECGYPPSRFHSYTEPEKKTVGTFATKEAAVREARTAMGSRWGIEWEELCGMGELEILHDGAERYEAHWVAGDSEYAHVIARRLRQATTGV